MHGFRLQRLRSWLKFSGLQALKQTYETRRMSLAACRADTHLPVRDAHCRAVHMHNWRLVMGQSARSQQRLPHISFAAPRLEDAQSQPSCVRNRCSNGAQS